jgi:hypothetical protein
MITSGRLETGDFIGYAMNNKHLVGFVCTTKGLAAAELFIRGVHSGYTRLWDFMWYAAPTKEELTLAIQTAMKTLEGGGPWERD